MNDDLTTLDTIRKFLGAGKPASIAPLDILQMVYFVACKAEDHDVYHSQQTLAEIFNTDVRTIARSQKRLASPEIDWIARPQRRGKTNAISVRYQNVPAEERLRLRITDDAKQIAFRYQVGLRKIGRRKFSAQWLPQQFLSAQRILNECKGDVELACGMIGHALSHPEHYRKSRQSLYHAFGRWKKIRATYVATQGETANTALQETAA